MLMIKVADWYSSQDISICKALRATRKAAGLSQQSLADRMGLSRQYVNTIEAGRVVSWYRYIPKINHWMRCCGASLVISAKVLNEFELPPGAKEVERLPSKRKKLKK